MAELRFQGIGESIVPMCAGGGYRLPLVGPEPRQKTRREERASLIVGDEIRPAIPRSGCSTAEPVSASPARAE